MRERILIAATILASGWLGACSKPTPSNGQETGATTGNAARQIELAEPARPEGAVVSDLEAGRPVGRLAVQPKRAAAGARVVREPAAAPQQAVVTEEPHVHAVSMTTSTAPEPVLRLATAPAAPVFGVARAADGSELPRIPETTWVPDRINRGPAIIIRGGNGRPDDDCDLIPRGHRIGSAVNRVTPPIGGGRVSTRGGIR